MRDTFLIDLLRANILGRLDALSLVKKTTNELRPDLLSKDNILNIQWKEREKTLKSILYSIQDIKENHSEDLNSHLSKDHISTGI